MGNQLSQAIKQIIISTNSIAYSQQYQKKKIQKQSQIETGYNIFNNYGNKQIYFDFTSFGKKPFYKDSNDQQVSQHLKKLQQKQQLLKKYKFWEDFDRIDTYKKEIGTFYSAIQNSFIKHVAFCLIFGRIFALNHNPTYCSTAISWKTIFKFFFAFSPLPILLLFQSNISNPINQQYFKSMTHQVRMYLSADEEINAYKYVQDIKYNFKYPTQQKYFFTRWKVNENVLNQNYVDAVNYYKRKYGIIEVPNFQINQKKETISSQ